MHWLMMILKLIPYIGAGINVVHADLPVEGKVKAAQDALAVAVAGAQSVLAPNDAALADAIGQTANAAIAQTVTAIHNKTVVTSPASNQINVSTQQ